MEMNKEDKKEVSNGNSTNNLSKILSSYLPKEVLDEIDINDSSKTNSLSKNSSSDNSMGKSTKSQTNNNNGNNNNSDSNNSGSNNNKGNNSDTSGNSKNDINNIKMRKIYHSYPKDIYQIKHKLAKHFSHENKYKILKENNHNLINVRSINRSFSGRNLSKSKRSYIIPKNKSNITFVKKSSKKKNDFCENKGNNYELNNEHRNILNNSDNNLTSNLNQWNEKKPKQLKLIYSHPNLNNYKIEKNSYGINLLNSSPNSDIINNTQRNKNIKLNGNNMNVKNLQLNKLYNINNNDINNRYNNRTQNKMNIQNSINGINKYIVSANSNVNKSQLNIDFMNLFQNGNLTNGFSHSFKYVNGINSEINNSINGNEILNIYNKFPKNSGENNFKSKNFQNLFYNLNPINNSNIIINNFRNNNKDIIINDPYSNNKYSEYYNIINNNNINNNGNFINKFQNNNNNTNQKNQNHNKKINQNNNQNYNHNGNSNYINGNGNMNNSINTHNEKDINNNNEFSDQQIDYLFSQLYSLPKEVCILLYIINKKGVNFFINLTKTIKGSKYLQNTLQSNPPKEMEVVCITKIICVNHKEIMCDHYGNYFLQKFFPFCNHHQRIEILISIKNDFINIANHICGNHSLQCLISLQNTNEEKEIIRTYTENNLKDLCIGINSSHVITKMIKFLKESERQYINNFIINNLIELCINSNGICVIKEFIYNMKSDNYIKLVISLFEKETKKLTFNQFGNYIIQEVIRFFGYNYCKNIITILINNLVEFSLAKFSSNVIDFLLDYLSKKQFFEFCDVLKIIFLEENNFKEMIKNKFSIYVIENCLQLLIKINENYYINSIRNNLGYAQKRVNEEENIDKNGDGEEFSFEHFLKLKRQIFQFIENNSAAKEKKKILALIKLNRHKRI